MKRRSVMFPKPSERGVPYDHSVLATGGDERVKAVRLRHGWIGEDVPAAPGVRTACLADRCC